MKALILENPEQLALRDAPQPETNNGEKVVRVAATGVCGSDMHGYLGHDARRIPPLILGHETAGEVVGEGVQVIVNPLVVCGECQYCKSGRDNICPQREIISMPPREGAFAEYVAMPPRNLIPLPASLTPQQGALAEPIACGHHSAALAFAHARAPHNNNGKAAVIGGGAIGLVSALSLVARGVGEVCIAETNAARREFLCAHNFAQPAKGKITIIDPPQLADIPQEGIAGMVIDAVGNKNSRALASAFASPGGVVVHIGLGSGEGGFDMRRLTLHEIILTGAYTYTAQEFKETVAWMAQGKYGALDWYQTRPLCEGAKVFAALKNGEIPAPKVLLVP